MRKLTRKGLVRKLDALCSTIARIEAKRKYGPMCPFCGIRPHDQAFHFISRSKYITRWDMDNLVASCGACNIAMEQDIRFVEKAIEWFKKNRGIEKWDELKIKSNEIAKFSSLQLEDIYNGLNRIYTNLPWIP